MNDRGLNQTQVVKATGLNPSIVGMLYRHPTVSRIDCNTAKKLLEFFELSSLDELYEIEGASDV
jgi:hypothetical protein